MKRPGNLLRIVWFGENQGTSRQVEFLDGHAAGGRNDADGRPTISDGVGQHRSVHKSGHVNIREHDLNVRAAFENGDSAGGIRSLDDFKPCVLDCFRRRHADQKLVLDYEDNGIIGRDLRH